MWLEQAAQGGAATLTSRLEREPVSNGGQWIEQVASRNYYSADNRLMVVQRYDVFPSPGTEATIDLGTWEEYWYDALGRRILTRARRDQVTEPDTSHYLCNASNACGSYKQRTLWDGAQLLYEWRSPEGTATGMTSGSAGYVYLDALDQPIALLRSEGTRVLNYTARGLAESSVFVNGSSGDCAIFVTGCTRVDWPARTQGAVYFTPNLLASGPSGPYTWFGTLADNGGGSTGMLYRRNRYFDPVSGQFTQQDPIGTGGGMNLWGFANGDPVNYSDPFGLCPENDSNCEALVRMLRAQSGSEFRAAADRYESQQTGRVYFYASQQNTSRWDTKNVDGIPGTYSLGNSRGKGGDVFLRGDVSTADFLLSAVHESVHLAGDTGETAPTHAAWRAYGQLSSKARSQAVFSANIFFQLWGNGFGAPLPASVTERSLPQSYFIPPR